MNRRNTAASAIIAVLLAGCGQIPLKPASTHISAADAPSAEGQIPPPVQVVPVLPKPEPTTRPETYSVVVNNVDVHDLLFALARDAKVNVDIEPGITGKVTLNAIDQTLPQLLTRIGRQVDMRYELRGQDLVVMRDTPFLRVYRVDYVNLDRNATMKVAVSSQLAGSSGSATAGGSGQTNSSSSLEMTSNNKFWETLIANIKDILRETDKVIPTTAPAAAGQAATAQPGAQQQAVGASQAASQRTTAAPVTFIEKASVIANPEAGVLSIRATSRQHARIQEFLDQVLANANRQVLIEATVAEVQLNNQYQRGIDWSKLRTGSSGFQFQQSSANTPAAINTNAFVVGYALGNYNFTSAVKLLESFGSVRVLSSPKISVLNNQAAVMRVTDDLVYFTLQPGTTSISVSGSGTVQAPATFTTTPNVSPVGLIISVIPQISDSGAVLLDVRPTIRRKIGDVSDPNPALAAAGVSSLIPVIQTREMESVLRVQTGQIAVLGGLMQDSASKTQDSVPGLNGIPGIGSLFEQRNDLNLKTELVIFLRATVLGDPSVNGDFREFRSLLPGEDYLSKPNPSKPAALD
ncbi:MAG: secretin N-terminal domain-containing protein [Burkholderiales bacterium]